MRVVILAVLVMLTTPIASAGPGISIINSGVEQKSAKTSNTSSFDDFLSNFITNTSELIGGLISYFHQSDADKGILPQEVRSVGLKAITPRLDIRKQLELKAEQFKNDSLKLADQNARDFNAANEAKKIAGSPFNQFMSKLFGPTITIPTKSEIMISGDILKFQKGTSGNYVWQKVELPGEKPLPGPILTFSDRYLYIQESPTSIIQWDLNNENKATNTKSISFSGRLAGFSIRGENFLAVVEGVGLITRDEGNKLGETQLSGSNRFLENGVKFFSTGLIAVESNPSDKTNSVFKIDFRTGKLYRYDLGAFTGFLVDKNILHLFNRNLDTVYDLTENQPRMVASILMRTKEVISSGRREGTKLLVTDNAGKILTSTTLAEATLPQGTYIKEKCVGEMEGLNKKLEAYRQTYRGNALDHRVELRLLNQNTGSVFNLTN